MTITEHGRIRDMKDRQGPVDRQLAGRCVLVRADDGAGGDGENDGPQRRNLTGIAVPFDTQTRIDNWFEGTFDEEFVRGAFKRTLGQRTPKLMFEHGRHALVGSMPLGRFDSLTETDDGLEVDAEMFDNWLIEPIIQGLDSEAIDSMSIRFRPIHTDVIEAEARTDEGKDNGVPLHRIKEAELFELGPVMFPAYEETSADLRSLAGMKLDELDLRDRDVRLRLAMALLSADGTAGDGAGSNLRPGTPPVEAGGPARQSGPTQQGHPDSKPRDEIMREAAALERFVDVLNIER